MLRNSGHITTLGKIYGGDGMMLLGAGITLIVTGGLVSVGFWLPALIDRQNLREILGSKYPLVYLIYIANGPLLLLAGILLLVKHFGWL